MIIKNEIIYHNGNTYRLEDLHTIDFHKFSNEVAFKYFNNSYFVNELFINFIQNSLALEFFIDKNNIKEITIKDASTFLNYYVCDIAKRQNISLRGSKWFLKKGSTIKFHSQIISSFFYLLYLMIKIPYKKKPIESGKIAIIRTQSSKSKMTKININTVYEDLFIKDSMYSFFPLFKRIKWVFIALKDSYKHYRHIKKIMKFYLGINSKYLIQSFYGKRLVHTNLFKLLLDSYFKSNQFNVFYTGNNLDRFAVIEEELAAKYKLKLICIPHGLEYGFKFPKCYTGDIFYATSIYAAKYFNNLYLTKKFIFDYEIIKTIFLKNIKSKEESKVVFFTEPREPWINFKIIKELLPFLKENNIKLYLKLHPKDIRKDYEIKGVEILDDFNLSISNNICFARKSTILLEALYNNSKPAAVLLNSKDKSMFFSFPSLQNNKIEQCLSIEEVGNWILNRIKETYEK
jgi:hypothetical protein